jgi:O-antigen ligase
MAVVAWTLLSHGLRPEVLMLAGALLLVLLGAGIAAEARLATSVQAGWLAAAALTAIVGLSQYLGAASGLEALVRVAHPATAYGNLGQANQYATFCWMGVALVLWAPLRLPMAVRTVLVILLAMGSAASASRTGMLEGGLLVALALLWTGPGWRERLLLCGVASIAYAAGVVLLPALLEMRTGVEVPRALWTRFGGDGCSSRLVLWSNVLHLIAQRPLAGWGWGELDYAHYMTLYEGPRFCEILDNAHNLPLHLAVELGVPAALLIVGGVLAWAWRRKPWREEDSLRRVAWALLALVGLHSLLEYPLWYGPFQMTAGVALGWLLAPSVPRAPASPLPRLAIAALLLAAAGYAAWDYARVSQVYRQPEDRFAAWSEDTLDDARRSWLFSGPAAFADLTLATPAPDNAATMYALAQRTLHYSPEPRVIERLVESATLLGRTDEAVQHLARYRAAFPADHEAWRRAQRLPLQP